VANQGYTSPDPIVFGTVFAAWIATPKMGESDDRVAVGIACGVALDALG